MWIPLKDYPLRKQLIDKGTLEKTNSRKVKKIHLISFFCCGIARACADRVCMLHVHVLLYLHVCMWMWMCMFSRDHN